MLLWIVAVIRKTRDVGTVNCGSASMVIMSYNMSNKYSMARTWGSPRKGGPTVSVASKVIQFIQITLSSIEGISYMTNNGIDLFPWIQKVTVCVIRRKLPHSVSIGAVFKWVCDWTRKFAPLSQPIRYNLVARVFPRFRQFSCFYSEFSLALNGISLSSDWQLWLIWSWLNDTQSINGYKQTQPT